nr:multidrug efflux SMR transporter [Azospirillum brasilense]
MDHPPRTRMSWLFLSVAIAFEIVGTVAMKMSDGMTRLWPSLAVVACYLVAFAMLAQALREIEVGVAYAIWSAVGTAAIAAIGIWVFGESLNFLKLAGILLIVAGVVSLRMSVGGA